MQKKTKNKIMENEYMLIKQKMKPQNYQYLIKQTFKVLIKTIIYQEVMTIK